VKNHRPRRRSKQDVPANLFPFAEPARNDTVLISGASIAGPSLAYWLNRCGFRPTVVEKARTVRPGGYPIDLRGIAVQLHHRPALIVGVEQPQARAVGGQLQCDPAVTAVVVETRLWLIALHRETDVRPAVVAPQLEEGLALAKAKHQLDLLGYISSVAELLSLARMRTV
jgi:hypothetical protein